MKKVLVLMIILVALIGCSKSEKQVEVKQTEQPEMNWVYDIEAGIATAKTENKLLMVEFMATWCPPCKEMEATTFINKNVVEIASKFVTVRIDVDHQGEVANSYNCNAGKYGGVGIPNILFMDHQKNRIKHIIGYKTPEQLTAVMDSVLTNKY